MNKTDSQYSENNETQFKKDVDNFFNKKPNESI